MTAEDARSSADLVVTREALQEILLETRRKISYADRLSAIIALARRALEATDPARSEEGV